jgi:hypothetical protein
MAAQTHHYDLSTPAQMDYVARFRNYIDQREARCKANGLKQIKRKGCTIWARPLEFWTQSDDGVYLTAKKQELGRAICAAS